MKSGNTVRAIVTAILAGLLVTAAVPYLRASMLVARAAGLGGWAGRVAAWNARAITETREDVPTRHGPVPVRVYRPVGRASSATLLVSGIHPAGADEPRLVGLARNLAASGLIAVTPEIRDLMQYRITVGATDIIEDTAVWLASRADLAPDQRVGMMGISFSGGLSIVAAGRPALRDHVAYVFSFGGHGNLPRVLNYLCTGVEPASPTDAAAGPAHPPHDYGVAVILHGALDRMVPPEQADPLRHAVETFLRASALAMVDQERAREEFAAAGMLEKDLPEPAATLMRYVNTRDVAALGRRLLPYVGTLGDNPSLSPDQSPPPTAPVFLLHGREDNVIPSAETPLLAAHLDRYTSVRYLLSGLVTHAEIDHSASMAEAWHLIAFWKELQGSR